MTRRWPWAMAALGAVGLAGLLPQRLAGAFTLPAIRLWQFSLLLVVAGLGAGRMLQRGSGRDALPAIPHSRLLSATALAVVALVVYGWVLGLDFLADDFFNLTLAVEWGAALYRPQPGWHHFFPLGMDLNAAPYYLAGWQPMWFHAHQLVVTWLVAASVTALADRWGLDARAALAAGVLWLTFPLQVEGVAWINILQYTYSTLFAIHAVLAFTRYTDGGHVRAVAASAGYTAASMLCLEQGAVIGLLCFAAGFFRTPDARRRPRAQLLAAVAAPCVVAGLLLLWKRLGTGQWGYREIGLADWLRTASGYGWSLLTPGSFAGLHVGLGLANRGSAGAFAGTVAALAATGLIAWRGSPPVRLGVVWAWCAGLPIVLGSPSIAPRHYMLPAVGVALVLAGWWSAAPDAAQRRARAWVLACAIIAGGFFIHQVRPNFLRASAAVRAVRDGIARHAGADVPYDRIALVDLPWGVGVGEWPVLTFATGARVLTGWLRGDHDLEAIRAIRVWRTGPPGRTASEAEPVDPATLAAAVADPRQVVLQWNPDQGRLERLRPPAS